MSRFWSERIDELSPYIPGEQPRGAKLVKLNTNENPFPPSPEVIEAIRRFDANSLRLYPDPCSSELRDTIARYHGLSADEVFVGNGSDEVLALAFVALLKHQRPLLFPDITYSFYPVWCQLFAIPHQRIPVDENFRIRIADYSGTAGGIILANPNAPTGIALSRDEIGHILTEHPDCPIVLDEAYVDFGAETAIPLVREYPNLLVSRTMSKSRSLAGLRVAYAVGHKDLIDGLTRVKDSFNSYPLDRIAQAAAIAAVNDEAYFQRTCAVVIANRRIVESGLQSIGFELTPSSANFVFARHPRHSGAFLKDSLREREVLVRHFPHPRIDNYLRISIGSAADADRLLTALRRILGRD